jgi:hypothetical protein
MERTGYQSPVLIGAAVLMIFLVFFLVIRARKVHREAPADEVTRARLKRVYLCFVVMNALGAVIAVGAMLIHVPKESQQGMGMGAGMLLAVTVWIALPVAAYNSLFLWRQRSVQVLWLLVLILISAFAMFENVLPDMGAMLIVLVYFLSTSALVVRGLITLHQGRPVQSPSRIEKLFTD